MASTSVVNGLMRLAYDAKGRSCKTSELYGKARQHVTVTGVAPVANTWVQQTGAAGLSAAHGDFKPGHFYAIDRVRSVGVVDATHGLGQFIRFVHSDFDGARPGGYIGLAPKGITYLSGGVLNPTCGEVLEFEQHGKEGMHPVFSADSPLQMYVGAPAVNTAVEYVIEFVDMGTAAVGTNSIEDVAACYATCSDDQAFVVATPYPTDVYNVASDRGNCVLRAFNVAGISGVAGRLSAPIDNLQPNAIVVVRNLAGYTTMEFRDIPIARTTTITAELSSYVAAA